MKKLFHQDEPEAGNQASAKIRSYGTVKRRIEITIEREVISITRLVAQPPANQSAQPAQQRYLSANEAGREDKNHEDDPMESDDGAGGVGPDRSGSGTAGGSGS